MTRNADSEHWARVSSEWTEWACAPNHDAFWAYREAFIAFVGRGDGEALDVGCGEGRVARELGACGYRVTASDPVPELVNAAKEAHRLMTTLSRRGPIYRSRTPVSISSWPITC